ncbi:MAG TPA: CsbD family protein [Aggregatilineaceae bacterium]|nr:CsbD family protein [Aggregatilineaceae bacterium]HMM27611.1 CsbD family protein [Aggregatilineaceae bacterium]
MDDKLKKNLEDMKSDMKKSGLWDQLEGNWKQFSGEVQKRWGRLTDDDMKQVQGRRDILEGKIQERYGKTREEVQREIDEWANELKF